MCTKQFFKITASKWFKELMFFLLKIQLCKRLLTREIRKEINWKDLLFLFLTLDLKKTGNLLLLEDSHSLAQKHKSSSLHSKEHIRRDIFFKISLLTRFKNLQEIFSFWYPLPPRHFFESNPSRHPHTKLHLLALTEKTINI